MEARVKDKKTIVLSERAAKKLGLKPGTRLVVRVENGRIVLEDKRRVLESLVREAEDSRRKAQEGGKWDPLEELLRDRYGEEGNSA